MMEIEFRGKGFYNEKWHYGSYLYLILPDGDEELRPVHYIVDTEDENYAVDPETVGQYTGKNDMKGKKMYEGDFFIEPPFKEKYEIVYDWSEFCWLKISLKKYENGRYKTPLKNFNRQPLIIGNKWDNPELLEESK